MAGLLTEVAIDKIIEAATELGLADKERRSILLADLPPRFTHSLPGKDNNYDQLLSDVFTLNRTWFVDGHDEHPMRTWLSAATRLVGLHPTAAVFRLQPDAYANANAILPRTNLPSPNDFFVGRESLRTELHLRLSRNAKSLASNQPVLISGYSGVGKTELAVAYGWQHLADWPGGVWLVRADGAEPTTQLAALAVSVLGTARADSLANDMARAEEVVAALSSSKGLLIVDNLDDLSSFKPWRDRATGVQLLITTRHMRLPGLHNRAALRVERLSTVEGIALLARYRADAEAIEHAEAVEGIVEALDGFAVALAAVGVYARYENASWTEKRDALLARPLATLDGLEAWTSREYGETPRYVEVNADGGSTRGSQGGGRDGVKRASAVFDETLTLLAERRPDARRALDWAARLPTEGFPLHWLSWLLRHDGGKLVQLPVGDPAEKPSHDLLADGLLRRVDADRVALHALLRAVLRRVDTTDSSARLDALFALGEARGKACQDAVTQPALRPELTSLLALAEALRGADQPGAAARIINSIVAPLHGLGRWTELHDALTPLTRLDGHRLGADDDDEGAEVLGHLGAALQHLGQPAAARKRMTQAAEIIKRRHGANHPKLAEAYNNLALTLRDLGELEPARHRMRKAITIWEQRAEFNQVELAHAYNNLALILRDLGELEPARHRMQQALVIDENRLDPDHHTLAVSYSNLASILYASGELESARQYIEQAIAIDERHFGLNHHTLAVRYDILASVVLAQGGDTEARSLWQRALKIREQRLPEHPDTPKIRAKLAELDPEAE